MLTGVGSLVVIVLALKSGLLGPPQHAISDKYSLFGALWAMVVYGAYTTERGISRFLAWKYLALFGLTIYSTYLFHWFPMHFIATKPDWWAMPAAIAVSIALGIAGYQMAERRLQHLRRPVVNWVLRKMPVGF